MQICLDYQPVLGSSAGIGRYTKMLASEIAPRLKENESLRIFGLDFRRRAKNCPIPSHAQLRTFRALPGGVIGKCWRYLSFPPYEWLAGKADVYHATNFILPPVHCGRSVVSVHDMSFERFPEFAEKKNYRYLHSCIRDTLERADRIITISEFSKAEIEDLCPAARGKVRVTYPGISPDFAPAAAEEAAAIKEKLGLKNPFLLTLSTIEPRKNLSFLVDVFERLAPLGYDLVIAGAPGWRCSEILERFQNTRFANQLHYVRFVPDGGLAALYTAASLFVIPSFYEGFGFPPLEAMACGTPVLSSHGGSLPEVLGDAAQVVSGWDADSWAHAALHCLQDESRRAAMREAGFQKAASYRWKTCAEQTLDIYRELAAL